MTNTEPYTLENAIRDICSISVAPAAKSEVERILERLLASERAELVSRLRQQVEEIDRKFYGDELCEQHSVQELKMKDVLALLVPDSNSTPL